MLYYLNCLRYFYNVKCRNVHFRFVCVEGWLAREIEGVNGRQPGYANVVQSSASSGAASEGVNASRRVYTLHMPGEHVGYILEQHFLRYDH